MQYQQSSMFVLLRGSRWHLLVIRVTPQVSSAVSFNPKALLTPITRGEVSKLNQVLNNLTGPRMVRCEGQ